MCFQVTLPWGETWEYGGYRWPRAGINSRQPSIIKRSHLKLKGALAWSPLAASTLCHSAACVSVSVTVSLSLCLVSGSFILYYKYHALLSHCLRPSPLPPSFLPERSTPLSVCSPNRLLMRKCPPPSIYIYSSASLRKGGCKRHYGRETSSDVFFVARMIQGGNKMGRMEEKEM